MRVLGLGGEWGGGGGGGVGRWGEGGGHAPNHIYTWRSAPLPGKIHVYIHNEMCSCAHTHTPACSAVWPADRNLWRRYGKHGMKQARKEREALGCRFKSKRKIHNNYPGSSVPPPMWYFRTSQQLAGSGSHPLQSRGSCDVLSSRQGLSRVLFMPRNRVEYDGTWPARTEFCPCISAVRQAPMRRLCRVANPGHQPFV